MSMQTVFRAIGRRVIRRGLAANQAATGRHAGGTAETVFATDLPVCRGTRRKSSPPRQPPPLTAP